MTTKQEEDYRRALAGFLQAGYIVSVAEFYAKVSAGIAKGNIVEGEDATLIIKDTAPKGATGANRNNK